MKKNLLSVCGFVLMALSLFLQVRLIYAYIVDRTMLLPTWWEEATYVCIALCYWFVYQLGMKKAQKIYPLHIVAAIEAAVFTGQVFLINNLLHWLSYNHQIGIRYDDVSLGGWFSYSWIAGEDIQHGVGRYVLVFILLYIGCKLIDALFLKKEFVSCMMAKLHSSRSRPRDEH